MEYETIRLPITEGNAFALGTVCVHDLNKCYEDTMERGLIKELGFECKNGVGKRVLTSFDGKIGTIIDLV